MSGPNEGSIAAAERWAGVAGSDEVQRDEDFEWQNCVVPSQSVKTSFKPESWLGSRK